MRNGQIFNCEAFGHLLREKRKEQGYRNTKDFSAAIYERTGLTINAETLARYERGERKPDIEQFLALAISLSRNNSPSTWAQGITTDVFTECLEGKPALFKVQNSLLSISQGLGVLERWQESGEMPEFERDGWRVRAFIEKLENIRKEILNRGGFSEEAEEMGVTEQEIETLTNRATILAGLLGV